MLELIYNNDSVTLGGSYDSAVMQLISETCSYFVPTADWMEKYQSGVWNGKISLFNKKARSFPSGLLSIIKDALNEGNIEFSIKDIRKKPTIAKQAVVDLGDFEFRDYQNSSIDSLEKHQRGILALCTGAGKTKSSCGIISRLSVYPVIFVVPSVSLLKQTIEEFNTSLKPLAKDFFVGEIGGGVCNISPNGVNVATYQTLLTAYDKKYSESKHKILDLNDKNSLASLLNQKKLLNVDLENSPPDKLKAINKKIKEIDKKILDKEKQKENKSEIRNLINDCQLLIIDEAHIAVVVIEYLAKMSVNSFYRCSLSATPRRTDNQDLRMYGVTGPVISKVTSSDLIKRGYLVKPYIYFVDMEFLDKTSVTYQETYKNAIVLSEQRNSLIRDFAVSMKESGRPTLIFVDRLDQGNLLEEMIPGSLFVPAKDGSDDSPITDEELNYRKRQLNRLENNEIIMIATQWANQGIDAPKISALVIGGSVSSPITIIQQIGRGLRKAEGKKDCVVLDFKMKEKSLRNHSNLRIKTLKEEPEFEIKIVKYKKDIGFYV